MPRPSMHSSIIIAGTALAWVLSSCSAVESPTSSSSRPVITPSASISDGAHDGNSHFFFLPPTVQQPSYGGVFDSSLSPEVVICLYDPTIGCSSVVADYTTTSGPGSETVRLDAADDLYIVNWHTDQFTLDASALYRIQVSVGAIPLGYADVQVLTTSQQAKNVQTDQYIPLVDGRTLPIKFRIEQGAVHVIEPGAGTWTSANSLPTARAGAGAGVIEGKLYVAGGSTATASLSALEAYDPTTNVWTGQPTLPALPGPQGFPASAVLNNMLFIMGGQAGGTIIPTVEVFDPVTNLWTQRHDLTSPRVQAGAAVVSGMMFLIGGVNTPSTLNTVEAYDGATDTWLPRAPMPTARYGAAVAVVNGQIYVIGGYYYNGANTALATVEAYDPGTDTWTTKSSLPAPVYGAAAGVINGVIYVAGGYYGGPVGNVYAYDPTTDKWIVQAALPTPRWAPAAGVINGRFLVGGGSNDCCASPVSVMEVLTP